jgi:hypothetical protein
MRIDQYPLIFPFAPISENQMHTFPIKLGPESWDGNTNIQPVKGKIVIMIAVVGICLAQQTTMTDKNQIFGPLAASVEGII